MKIYVQDIKMNNGYVPQNFRTVSVVFHDDQQDPHKSATVSIYIDKGINTIPEIETTAIKEACAFLSRIVADEG